MLVRDVLNELRWRVGRLDDALVTYVHRGAPGDVMVVEGRDIVDVGRTFLVLRRRGRTVSIPHHRVLRVELDEDVLWERRRD